jgi:phosphomevalonate kinase
MAPLTIGFPFFQNVCPSVGGFDPHLGVTKNGIYIHHQNANFNREDSVQPLDFGMQF